MATPWMVRAGEQGYLIDDFERGYIAIGWSDLGDLSNVASIEAVKEAYSDAYPDAKPGARANAASMIHKFRSVLAPHDPVITYNPRTREYLIGEITSDYSYSPGEIGDFPHIRTVSWQQRVSRDQLSVATRNSLGSTLTLFSVNAEAWEELQAEVASPGPKGEERDEEQRVELEQIREETAEKAHELIKDRILDLTPDQMERLVAALLRALGYRARVTAKGADRGVDVLASPDGLGLDAPRIKAEVKHRKGTSMGAPEVREFLGGLRDPDRGLYVSTGGFTKEARYEAERASVPATLVDLDLLAELVAGHYEAFDSEGRALVPLVKVYWPAE